MKWLHKYYDDDGEVFSPCLRWRAKPTGIGNSAWMVEAMAAIGGRGGFGLTPDAALANWAVENRYLAAQLNALADAAEAMCEGRNGHEKEMD